jgi:hypothetical protein
VCCVEREWLFNNEQWRGADGEYLAGDNDAARSNIGLCRDWKLRELCSCGQRNRPIDLSVAQGRVGYFVIDQPLSGNGHA